MKLYDYERKKALECDALPQEQVGSQELLAFCHPRDVPALHSIYQFDESTVAECTDLDETVRYTSYDGYDFVSIVHVELETSRLALREINVYVSPKYLFLVFPDHDSPKLEVLEKSMHALADSLVETDRPGRLSRLYYVLMHKMLTDYSDAFEDIEDHMEEAAEEISEHATHAQLQRALRLRRMAYTAKKHMRALSYVGEQLAMDENGVLDKRHTRYFRNVETRLKRLSDFSENLYELGNELLRTYDSRLAMRTNEMVNKLTAITLMFGPLTVITGIYGMNFDFMPELGLPFGYFCALGLMAAVTASLYILFKRKKWL